MQPSKQEKYIVRRLDAQLTQRIDLFVGLVDRDIKLLYNRSTLGIAWTLVKPLMQLLVFTVVFTSILANDIPQFSSFVFSGLIAWSWFQGSLIQSTNSIIRNGALIRQPGFPAEILPVVTVTTGVIHFFLSFPVLILFLILDGVQFNFSLLALPIIIGIQALFTLSLAYALAALNVTFRDTQHTLEVLLQMMFYLTGIFYKTDVLPGGIYRLIFELNPMLQIITAYRRVFLEGAFPNWIALGAVSLVSAVLLPIGYQFFQRQRVRFVEEI